MSKKILLATRPLVPPWDEASKNFAYFLGREIKKHTLTLLTTHTHLEGLPKGTMEMPIFPSHSFNIYAKWKLFSYLRSMRNTFDITHYLFTPTRQNTFFIKKFAFPKKGKTIQTIATLRDDLYSKEQLSSLLFADTLITYTKETQRKLEKLGFHNVHTIYPGIDLQRFHPQEKSTALLSQLGITSEKFIIMYPGEYVRLGATDLIADTLISFFSENPETDIRFVFACRIKNADDARKKEQIKKRFIDANVLGYISFSDTISDMPALYNTADLIIFPVTNLKGKFDVPLVIIEAYACGKPVILSDLSAFKEFSNEHICVTIPTSSREELIQSIKELRENTSLRIRISDEARKYAETYFDLHQTARQYEEIYDSL